MSLDLEIKLYKPVQVQPLLVQTQQVLCSLLKFSRIGTVIFSPMETLIAVKKNSTYFIALEDLAEEKIELTFTFVPNTPGYEDPEEEGWWAGITVRAVLNAPIKMALSAALAIALASLQQSTIRDERRAWTASHVTSPINFLEKMTITKVPDSLDEAIKLFNVLVGEE